AEPWERSLESLLEPAPAGPESRPGGTPLAVEITLSPAPPPTWSRTARSGPMTLLARLVRPGRNGWVGGGLSWTKLENLHLYGDHLVPHVRLLQELYALHRAREGRSHYYSYGEEKAIDLSVFESGQLWPLLDEAEAIGLRLVHARKWLGDLERYRSAELCLDVTRGDGSGSLAIHPGILIDGIPADAVPVLFIGTQGHGLVYVDPSDTARSGDLSDWHLRLARMAKPVPQPLQRLALERHHLDIPAAGHAHFREGYYPRLRHVATVTSSDGSFTPPEISDPTLVLRASYGAGHDLDLAWEWAYEVGDARLRLPLGAAGDGGFRDVDA